MQGKNYIAIDFETATGKRASICEAGICVVRDGKIVETRSWLVRPQGNSYSYWNMQIHGIRPNDTADSPEFPEVWTEISKYLSYRQVILFADDFVVEVEFLVQLEFEKIPEACHCKE